MRWCSEAREEAPGGEGAVWDTASIRDPFLRGREGTGPLRVPARYPPRRRADRDPRPGGARRTGSPIGQTGQYRKEGRARRRWSVPPDRWGGRDWFTRWRTSLSVRPRRRADPDGDGSCRGLEGDVRRVPARAGGANGGEVRPVRPSRRLRRVRRRQAALRGGAIVFD